jgi:ribosome-associated toxin RatA of RatAB toxin-antitoxin module
VADKTAQTIYIDADPSTVMDVIADIGSYPDWVAEYKETEVLEADDEGYPKTARLVLDAAVLKDTMVLAYSWPPDRGSVKWKLVSSSLLRSLEGAYHLSPKGSGTDVTYELSVDLVIPMIGLLKRKAERRLTDTALKDLKKRVEAERISRANSRPDQSLRWQGRGRQVDPGDRDRGARRAQRPAGTRGVHRPGALAR